MGAYIVRRVLYLIPMMLVISFLVYLGLEAMPGDAVDYMISPDALSTMDSAQLDRVRAALGLDQPFIVRYFRWVGSLLQGNFGYSLQSGVPVSTLLANALPATVELSVVALLVSSLVGGLLGVASALKKGGSLDVALSAIGMIGVAVPQFLFGLICIIVFSFNLHWLPVGGRMAHDGQTFFERLPYLVMPATVLGLSMLAGVMRYSRASMLDSLNRDFVKTARSKGLPEWRINLIHGLRTAMVPVVVLIGFRLPMLIGGAVVIEQVFQWPGVGVLFLQAVSSQNAPVVMMIGFATALFVLISSLLVDVMTAILDPRVQLG